MNDVPRLWHPLGYFAKTLPTYVIALVAWLVALSAQAQVRRAEVIAIADAYRTLQWTPAPANAFHGMDGDGVRVDTPDSSFAKVGTRPGWWVSGKVNTGMPYKWGGFSTPEEFIDGLKKGLYAGDIYTAEKRRLRSSAVSRHCVGIDCSGLVSRCWKLPRAQSTRTLPTLCDPIAYADLKAGDILNSPDNHVLIFKQFTDATRERMLAYEAGSQPSWKVLLNDIPLSLLQKQGFQPLRYRLIRD